MIKPQLKVHRLIHTKFNSHIKVTAVGFSIWSSGSLDDTELCAGLIVSICASISTSRSPAVLV